MCHFSEIKSHPDLPLENHLSQVAEIALELLKNKKMDFNGFGISESCFQDLVKMTALLHDIGKCTTFFQNRLSTGYKFPNGEHQHSGLSVIIAYKPLIDYCIKNNIDKYIALAPIIAIKFHHSEFSNSLNILPNDYSMEKRIENFYKCILELPLLQSIGLSVNEFPPSPLEIDCEIEDLLSDFSNCIPEKKMQFNILTLFIYSLLLEADKAYLAVSDKELYNRRAIKINKNVVDDYKIVKFTGRKTKVNKTREKAYCEVVNQLENIDLKNHIYSLTLPTGMGKTLLSASWALKLRDKIEAESGFIPKIIVALPFLSIIEQSSHDYEDFLGYPKEDIFLKTHSLSSLEFKGYEQNTAEFFINIWNSQVIMTTFDQLLYAFLSFRPKSLMRFHNLMNCIIIMDEIQALPPHLWDPFSNFMNKITKIGNSYLLVMSATMPHIIDNAVELIPKKKENEVEKGPERYFEKLSRYKLILEHRNLQDINEFIEDLKSSLKKVNENKIMIVLNTRDSAKKVYEELKKCSDGRDLYFLSSYVIPKKRLERINQINESKNALVVTTQCIEAGVDIDMDYVIRDFGPLDSIIQVAGRCNREGLKNTKNVKVIRLYDPNFKSNFNPSGEFNRMVYDNLSLDATLKILDFEEEEVLENKVFGLAKKYFFELRRKDLGISRTKCLLDLSHEYMKDGKKCKFDIRRELRGDLKQYNVIVENLAPDLREEIENILSAKVDRWEKRRNLKAIANKISINSISVNAYKFDPEEIATKGKGNFYFLNPEYYDEEIGFNYIAPPNSYIV